MQTLTQREIDTLKPLHDNVLIKCDLPPKKTEAGIILPEKSGKVNKYGTIVAVGPGEMDPSGQRMPMDVLVTDRVMFVEYAGEAYKVGEDLYLLMSVQGLLATVEAE